ncbi:MAG: LysR family transcriptional regulator [Myxococcota bacterium]
MDASDLGMLVTLNALLEESSVSGAARRLGLSPPAVSHALARLRERFDDPLLVRSGRGMVLTPRALALRPGVQDIVTRAQAVFQPPEAVDMTSLRRSFSLIVSDYVLLVVGEAFESRVRSGAPRLDLRYSPNTPRDADRLRQGEVDLAVGIYGELPPEFKIRPVITDRLICVLRADHPASQQPLTLESYVQLDHLQVAPRGRPGGYVDEMLAEYGARRRVARAVPYFSVAMRMVAGSDDVLTAPERLVQRLASELPVVLMEPPLPFEPYALSLLWHPRLDNDPGHRWLRTQLVEACSSLEGWFTGARRRLSPSDPTDKR